MGFNTGEEYLPDKSKGQTREAASFEAAVPELLQTMLEGYLPVDLQNASVERHSEERTVRVGVRSDGRENLAKGGASDAVNRKIEVLVVQNVERGRTDRKSEAFADLEILRQRQICIEESWSTQRVTRIAEVVRASREFADVRAWSSTNSSSRLSRASAARVRDNLPAVEGCQRRCGSKAPYIR